MGKIIDPSGFPASILVRIADPGDDNQYLAVGTEPSELDDSNFGEVSEKTARYVLAGVGRIEHVAPVYIEGSEA